MVKKIIAPIPTYSIYFLQNKLRDGKWVQFLMDTYIEVIDALPRHVDANSFAKSIQKAMWDNKAIFRVPQAFMFSSWKMIYIFIMEVSRMKV
jgi:hypothetical protein